MPPGRLPWGEHEEDPRCDLLKDCLLETVRHLSDKGVNVFLCGMARGSDTLFAEAVLRAAEPLCAQKKLDEGILAAMRAAMRKFDAIFCEEVKTASLIHGDLNIANIMVGKGGKLTGLIDPLNAMYADREYGLFQFNNLTGKRFFLCDTYIRKYGASERCAQKLAFYGLWNEVYCTIRSGVLVNLIMKPLVKNMRAQLEGL